MNNFVKKFRQMAPVISMIISQVLLLGCKDEDSKEYIEGQIPETEVAAYIAQMNQDIADMQQLADGKLRVLTYFQEQDNVWVMELENGHLLRIYPEVEKNEKKEIPILGINEEGYWIYEFYNTEDILTDVNGEPVAALAKTGKGTFVPRLRLNEKNYWEVSFNGMQWKQLTSRPTDVISTTSAAYSLMNGLVADEKNKTVGLSLCCGELIITSVVLGKGTTEAWNKFVLGTSDNVLLDYSYAGYDHGETAPKDGFAWGYKVCNVKQRMEQENIPALEAFIRILDENKLIRKTTSNATNANAKIVIYFPAGEYVLHEEAGKNFPYDILGGNFIIKGDGPQLTRLVMKTPNGDTEATNVPMLSIKHTNSPNNAGHSPLLANVVENAKKGESNLVVSSTTGLKPGKWVQLRLRSGNKDLLAKELGPITPTGSWSIEQQPVPITAEKSNDNYGIKVTEFHQIKSVGGNRVVFYEPIMHDIDTQYDDCLGWEIREYKYYENVGIEDLTFVGQAITPYYHHGDGAPSNVDAWRYDQEYRPIAMVRLVNSWVRNVDFESVSEALTISESANCSAYNIEIRGNRGHGAVRAAGSTRIFIGKINDQSKDGTANKYGVIGQGQWHGCGVSKPSIGNVIWNSNWGSNACFESHATQPRATLFDNCSGGLVRYHAGGAEDEAPNHLSDLTIWNLNVTGTIDEQKRDFSTNFTWWNNTDKWWKIYPPIVVGTHGQAVTFSQEENQLAYEESTGTRVTPESLYEAQLEKRLGAVPAWLRALK